jgi:2-methylcitrate dehydratase PrpD
MDLRESDVSIAAAVDALVRRCVRPDMGDELHDVVQHRIFDALVAASIGLRIADSEPLSRLNYEGPEGRIRRLVAALRATEIDDIYLPGCVTAGSVIVPTALIMAGDLAPSSCIVVEAIAAGYEAMTGFAAMIDGPGILYRGFWPTLAAAPFGAAMTTARLLGLDARATRSALALAVGRTMAAAQRSMPRWLQLGHAAVDGVLAAQAAAAGFQASVDVIGQWAQALGLSLDPLKLAPGSLPRIGAVDCKTYPTSRQGLAAIEAFRQLHGGEAINPADRIEIALPAAYRAMVGATSLPTDRLSSLLSTPYQMALVVNAPEHLFDVSRSELPLNANIVAFLARVSVREDAELSAAYPAVWGGAVKITRPDGSVRSMTSLEPEGSARRPLNWDQLREKATALAEANRLGCDGFVPHYKALRRHEAAPALLELVEST